jgi:hypothetical protein
MNKQKVIQRCLIILVGLLLGGITSYLLFFTFSSDNKTTNPLTLLEDKLMQKQVIGFLPYWLLAKANSDYSSYLTTLTYFGLTIDTNGKILKLTNPQEQEPGWFSLKSGKADQFLTKAKNKKLTLSLLVFASNEDSITTLMENPIIHAKNLIADIKPLFEQYKFTDLNIDIESTQFATDEKRANLQPLLKR